MVTLLLPHHGKTNVIGCSFENIFKISGEQNALFLSHRGIPGFFVVTSSDTLQFFLKILHSCYRVCSKAVFW